MAKFIRITMPNGEIWDVPAEIVVADRARTIATNESKNREENYQKLYNEEYNNAFSDNDLIIEWARKNFNWSKVESRAFKFAPAPRLTQKQKEEAWMTGTMTVVSRV
jgi:hypothetical protein